MHIIPFWYGFLLLLILLHNIVAVCSPGKGKGGKSRKSQTYLKNAALFLFCSIDKDIILIRLPPQALDDHIIYTQNKGGGKCCVHQLQLNKPTLAAAELYSTQHHASALINTKTRYSLYECRNNKHYNNFIGSHFNAIADKTYGHGEIKLRLL